MTPTPDQIVAVLDHFAEHCGKRFSTYRKLQRYASTPKSWRKCYSLFQSIRNKTLRAEARGDHRLTHQYLFEEICAKTLYNFSIAPDDEPFVIPAPFDDDSADFVFPIAGQFADYLGVSPPRCIPADELTTTHGPRETGG
ncbi:hypothetical protein [Novipirellula rosea]|uniref:hypothetical protein n=1 Tax=Novipirellula rosea TaxID=1031540 RepID=UPI0031EBEFC6